MRCGAAVQGSMAGEKRWGKVQGWAGRFLFLGLFLDSLHPESWERREGGSQALKSKRALSWRGRTPAGISTGSAPTRPRTPPLGVLGTSSAACAHAGASRWHPLLFFPPAGGIQMETICSAPAGWPRIPWPRRVPAGTPRAHGEMLRLSGPNPAARSGAAVPHEAPQGDASLPRIILAPGLCLTHGLSTFFSFIPLTGSPVCEQVRCAASRRLPSCHFLGKRRVWGMFLLKTALQTQTTCSISLLLTSGQNLVPCCMGGRWEPRSGRGCALCHGQRSLSCIK